jgi:hypothetical protein
MATLTDTASYAPEQPLAYVPASRNEVIKVVILGLIVGLAVPLLSLLLENYFIVPVFCNGAGDGFNICSSGGVVANHIAAIIVGFAAFAVLMHWAVYRALLLVVAATIAMWGLKKYADPLTVGSWIEYFLFSALLYAVAYTFFYWILRLHNFVVSLILTIVAVIVAAWAVVV